MMLVKTLNSVVADCKKCGNTELVMLVNKKNYCSLKLILYFKELILLCQLCLIMHNLDMELSENIYIHNEISD